SKSDGSALLNVGEVHLSGGEMPPLVLAPRNDGTYPSDVTQGQLAWKAGGEPITIGWAHPLGDPDAVGSEVQMTPPPYVSLTPDSAFFQLPNALPRTTDLRLAWTADTTPSSNDGMVVNLRQSNMASTVAARLLCTFAVSAGQGVVPAAALALL